MAKLLGSYAAQPVCEALGLDPNMVRRIVIDYAPDGAVIAHVEMYADERILALIPTFDGVKIERESRLADG